MAMIVVLLGFMAMAYALIAVGANGLQGVPDSQGRQTSKGVAVACFVLGLLVAIGTVVGGVLFWM